MRTVRDKVTADAINFPCFMKPNVLLEVDQLDLFQKAPPGRAGFFTLLVVSPLDSARGHELFGKLTADLPKGHEPS